MPKITFTDNHLVLSAAGNAERAALSLFSMAGTIYPGDNRQPRQPFHREVIECGISLGSRPEGYSKFAIFRMRVSI